MRTRRAIRHLHRIRPGACPGLDRPPRACWRPCRRDRLRQGRVPAVDVRGRRLPRLGVRSGLCRGSGRGVARRELPAPIASPRRTRRSTADFVLCRHTLEHVGAVAGFLALVRRACGDDRRVRLGFEVPDPRRILDEGAFWDVYYEHCLVLYGRRRSRGPSPCAGSTCSTCAASTASSTSSSMRRRGGGGHRRDRLVAALADDLAETAASVAGFSREARRASPPGGSASPRGQAASRRVALWGSGSKAVGFLTTIGDPGIVDCVVDINPARQGRYMPGCTMPIVEPAASQRLRPTW